MLDIQSKTNRMLARPLDSAKPLVCLEVHPCTRTESKESAPSILAAAVKVHCLNWCIKASLAPITTPSLEIQFCAEPQNRARFRRGKLIKQEVGELNAINTPEDVLWLPQLDPLLSERWPCQCFGYVKTSGDAETLDDADRRVVVTEETVVRVLPLNVQFLDRLTGELPQRLGRGDGSDVVHNHNPETVKELKIRLKRLLVEPVMIGTTNRTDGHLNGFNQVSQKWNLPKTLEFARDGALLLHSPDHGAGKTRLVEHLARAIGCELVHTIQIGPLLGKHGAYADVALECLLHESVLTAALQGKSICIILDHLSSILPPTMTVTSGAGDAASPVLGAIADYLRTLTYNLTHNKMFPFPCKNPLYNIHGESEVRIPVRLCLVAVASCPDDGWKSATGQGPASSVFNLLVAAKYRLPVLTAPTRLTAFQRALEKEGVSLSVELQKRMPFLAASAVWARGIHFQQVAQLVRSSHAESEPATEANFVAALRRVQKLNATTGTDVEFLATENDGENDCFEMIGGNTEAKTALEEALAMDEGKRRLLACFGMSPPTGVLFYGEPGTGKTMLAKAVAKKLRSTGSVAGGAFVSISSTDVARAEVGTGEKILVAAFETARANAPAVVFIDEFQALFRDRSSGGTSRLTTTLLTMMDDCGLWSNLSKDCHQTEKRVIVIAATNTPWMIDKAFLRPGRFDRIIHVGLPKEDERHAILELIIGRMKIHISSSNKTELGQICRQLAQQTRGYSGADLAALCRSAAIQCLLNGDSFIDKAHFNQALQNSQPSSSAQLVKRIERWKPHNKTLQTK